MAVYTEVSDRELDGFLAAYDVGEAVACKGIAEGVENSNFLVQTDRGATYILTLYEKRVDPADLPFFLGLMDHLAGRGLPCPVPVKGTDGAALRHLNARPAALITFLAGRWPRRIEPWHCRALGVAMAQMHLAGQDYALRRANALDHTAWRPLFEQAATEADAVQAGLAAEVAAELERLETGWPDDLPAGVIHADLFPDNVFFLRDHLSGLIDFYFACNDLLAYDIAICLNAWCFEPDGQFNITKARQMLIGYSAVRPLRAAEITALPLLARGAAMRFLLTRLYDWVNTPPGALVVRKDPLEYLRKLRFHAGVRDATAYGLDLP